MVKTQSTNHLSLKGSHSSQEPKINVDANSLKLKVTKVINNNRKQENTNSNPGSAVIPPRPRSGCGSFKSKTKRSSSKPGAVGNFFISQHKQHLFLNEDDVDTYISYEEGSDQKKQSKTQLHSPSNYKAFNEV